MREVIWYGFAEARYGFEYLTLYLDLQKKRRKFFKASILVLSTSGVMGWGIWEYAPQIACLIIAIVEIIQLLGNQIILKEKEIEKCSELKTRYFEYSNCLEELWIDFENNSKDQDESKRYYYELKKQKYFPIEKLDNELDIPHVEKLINKSKVITDSYLQRNFNYH